MADAPATPQVVAVVNDLPAPYPAHSTTSDKPTPTAAVPAAEPVVGEPTAADLAAAALLGDDTPGDVPGSAAVPKPPKRAAPSKADRELTELRAQFARLEGLVATAAVPAAISPAPEAPEPKPIPAPVRPKRADFDDPDAYDVAVDAYVDARIEWKTAQAATETEAQRARRESEATAARAATEADEGNRRIAEAWSEKVEETKERLGADDFDAVAFSDKTPMTMPMVHAIVESDNGPEIAYWLGQHPDEATRIAALRSPVQQALAIGRIEAAFAGDDAPPAAVVPAATVVPAVEPALTAPRAAASPRPIRPVRPQSAAAAAPSDEQTSEARIAKRVAELRKENGTGLADAWGARPPGNA